MAVEFFQAVPVEQRSVGDVLQRVVQQLLGEHPVGDLGLLEGVTERFAGALQGERFVGQCEGERA